ncbi:unnamed protein product [Owenia fusiformis]|uniref:Centromere protein O n=1 Tax=Owenia fusiformis TaxID=6347 RepID=A0A8J1Y2D6_OWEFU|nr:unnamed protein product [Owenia fusiformis]
MDATASISMFGSIRRLQEKEKRGNVSTSIQSQQDRKMVLTSEISRMKKKLLKINNQKSKLQRHIRKKKLETSAASLTGSNKEVLERLDRDSLLNVQLRKLENIQYVQRMIGPTFRQPSPNKLCVCLDTSYKGRYFAPIYIDFTEASDSGWRITNHTLPLYVPIAKLAPDNLVEQKDVFLQEVQRHIFGYHVRNSESELIKEELEQVYGVAVALHHSASYDHIELEIQYKADTKPVRIALFYNDLSLHIPTSVKVKGFPTVPVEFLPSNVEKLKDNLLQIPLSECFA